MRSTMCTAGRVQIRVHLMRQQAPAAKTWRSMRAQSAAPRCGAGLTLRHAAICIHLTSLHTVCDDANVLRIWWKPKA